MFRQLTICDAFGNQVNKFNPQNLFLKYELDQEHTSEQGVVQAISNNQSTSYEYGTNTFFISDIIFSLGSGTGNDDWSLYEGQYDNDGSPNNITGYASDGTLSVSPNFANHRQLPYYYHWDKESSVGANTPSTNSIFLPQSRISVLETNSSGIVSVLINIKQQDWGGLFTNDGISWETHKYNSAIVGNGYGLDPSTNSYADCTLAITNGLGWEGCEYPSWSSAETLFIPYDLLEGKDIAFGLQMSIGQEFDPNDYSVNASSYNASFSEAAFSSPFSQQNIGLIPYLQFSKFDEVGLSDIYVSQQDVTLNQSINTDEQASGTYRFSVENFEGQVTVCVFDNSDIGTPEYAYIVGSTLINTSYNEIDDMANYGIVDFVGGEGFGKSLEISEGVVYQLDFNYQPTGQIGSDSFTFYVILNSLSSTLPESYQEDFDLLEPYQKILFGGTSSINVNYQGFELAEEEYVPDENGAIIENPSDVMFHLAEQELGYNQDVNVDKIVNARNNQSDFKLGFSVNEEIEGKNLFQEIAQSSKCVPTFNNGMFSFAYIKDTYTKDEELDKEPIFTINEQDVIKYSFSRTSVDKLYTKVNVKYKYDYGLDNYLESVTRTAYNPDVSVYSSDEILMGGAYGITGRSGDIDEFNRLNYYGLKFNKELNSFDHQDTIFTLENKYIRDKHTAEKLAEHLVYLYMNVHNVIELTLPLKYYNLEVGDLCDFNEMILGKKMYGENYVLSEADDMPIRCGQYILPLFMVTNITKTIKNVKVNLMQMHHNSDSDLIWDNVEYPSYSVQYNDNILPGDVDGDGQVTVLDIVQVVSHILGTDVIQITEYADANQDGVINVLDIVSMVNSIVGE